MAARIGLRELAGTDLGSHTISYDDGASILYNLAVGASSTDLDLVYERDLRPLPTYACGLGLWAVEAAGRLGAYDPLRSLHAAQRLTVHERFPASGRISMSGSVATVYDKGKGSLVEVEVSSSFFTAKYGIFLPGVGGWGGERGPSNRAAVSVDLDKVMTFQTSPNQAALYRLTGDRHPVHIDPEQARSSGFERPILHGLCTVGIATRLTAACVHAHPADLHNLHVRFSAPVYPGDRLDIVCGEYEGVVHFEARVADRTVLSRGRAAFANSGSA
ncbi:MAG: MaoC/PaaZ C-terminal domain-containing protein [Actinomycetota bacterium]